MGSNVEQQLQAAVENCLVPKLHKNFEECEKHELRSAYDAHRERFLEHYGELVKILEDPEVKANLRESPKMIGYLFVLFNELQTDGVWADPMYGEHSLKMAAYFEDVTGVKITDVLRGGQRLKNRLAIFEACMELLHRKLTPEDFKKYPSLIETYCSIVKDVKEYRLYISPTKIMPIAMLLTDDYVPLNRIKGLKCAGLILQSFGFQDPGPFAEGNYYEVIHSALMKAFMERDAEVTNSVISSLTSLLVLLPKDVRPQKLDETYALTLEQVLTESNVYRKVILYRFTKRLIQQLRSQCGKRRTFQPAIVDGIMMCCNEGVQDILLVDVLECLEEWIKHTWATWNLQTDFRILSELMKLQCVSKPTNSRKVVKLIATLIAICSEEEQLSIVKCLEQPPWQVDHFTERVEDANKYVSLSM